MDLAHLTSEQLVEMVLRQHAEMKRVGAGLDTRAPDETASRRVEQAYREGIAPGWLAAYLLGRVGHACGLPLLNELLHSGQQTTVSYAAAALVRVDAGSVCQRMEALLLDAPKLMLREAAARALTMAKPSALPELVLRAAAERRIRPSTASHCLRDVEVEPAEVQALLLSRQEHSVSLGTDLVFTRPELASAHAGVRAALSGLLADPEHRMAPSKRVKLTKLVRAS